MDEAPALADWCAHRSLSELGDGRGPVLRQSHPRARAHADLRNWICNCLFVLVALVPVATFWRAPWALFTSATSGWFVFSFSYSVAGLFFDHLQTRLNKTPFHMFLLGAGSYAVLAVAIWVWDMLSAVIAHGLAHSPERSPSSARPNE